TTSALGQLFKRVAPYLCTQPCYFGGPFALNFATDDKHLLKLDAKHLAKRQKKRGVAELKYWTPEGHVGAFALPAYVRAVGVAAALSGEQERGEAPAAADDGEAAAAPPSAVEA